jgi:hypothetical protein
MLVRSHEKKKNVWFLSWIESRERSRQFRKKRRSAPPSRCQRCIFLPSIVRQGNELSAPGIIKVLISHNYERPDPPIDEWRSGGVVCRYFDDLDAVWESPFFVTSNIGPAQPPGGFTELVGEMSRCTSELYPLDVAQVRPRRLPSSSAPKNW